MKSSINDSSEIPDRPPLIEKYLCEHVWYDTLNPDPGFPIFVLYCPKCHMIWKTVDPPQQSYRLKKGDDNIEPSQD